MATVLDYSGWRPTPAQLKAAGVVGVIRYIAPAAWGWPKAMTATELLQLRAAGIAVAFNFEAGTQDYQGGATKGAQQGAAAAQAMKELGQGTNIPVYVSIDTSVPSNNYGLALDYLRAFKAAVGRNIGLYGQGDLTELAMAAGVTSYGWQSESDAFPGNGILQPNTAVRQRYGVTVPGLPTGQYDYNETHKDDWGQIPRPSAPIPKPAPQPPDPAPPKTTPQGAKVFSPPLDMPKIVSALKAPNGGVWLLGIDGSIWAFGGAPYYGAANNQTYWGNRTAKELRPFNTIGYTIVAVSVNAAGQNETYDYGPK